MIVKHGVRVRDEIAYFYAPPIDAVMGDPLTILMEYVKQSSLRLMDLFAQFDRDNSMSVSKKEFKIGLKVRFIQRENHMVDRCVRCELSRITRDRRL